MNEMMKSINYISKTKQEERANKLAIKVGNIYMASLMIYKNIPETEENIKMCKKIVDNQKQKDKEYFNWFINGGWKEQ